MVAQNTMSEDTLWKMSREEITKQDMANKY